MKHLLFRAAIVLAWVSSLLLVLVIGYLIFFLLLRGLPILGTDLFFGDTPAWAALSGQMPVWEGIWPACVGTLALIFMSAGISIPLGVSGGIYLAEYGRGKSKHLLTFFIDVLAGTPSILMGLLGFAAILFIRNVFGIQARTNLLLASLCLAFLVLPYIIKGTQMALEGVPDALRMTGFGLGMTRAQTIIHLLLPGAAKGIFSGIILALGRAAEDTAVILLTGVVANGGIPRGLSDKFEALPFHIYYLSAEYQNPQELSQAFGTALVLLCMTSLLFISAHFIHNQLEKRWK
jgi:phosphate transport system permease protein